MSVAGAGRELQGANPTGSRMVLETARHEAYSFNPPALLANLGAHRGPTRSAMRPAYRLPSVAPIRSTPTSSAPRSPECRSTWQQGKGGWEGIRVTGAARLLPRQHHTFGAASG